MIGQLEDLRYQKPPIAPPAPSQKVEGHAGPERPHRPLGWAPRRLGVIMEPRNGLDVEGVLNPAGAVGPDGAYYLFPRLVAAGNHSRIGIARVTRNKRGEPTGAQRLGLALIPANDDERYGVEDPRLVRLEGSRVYAMTYTAYGPRGARIGFAHSTNLYDWTRQPLVVFDETNALYLNEVDNKDAVLLPRRVTAPDGTQAYALIHRPMFPGAKPVMWISYLNPLTMEWGQHRVLYAGAEAWEADRVGAGAVIETRAGWLLLYHGVEMTEGPGRSGRPGGQRVYRAGALLLSKDRPDRVLARTVAPLFTPETDDEKYGTVNHVVFPSALDRRGDDIDVYYGAADRCICAVRLSLEG